jgi:hypothetical protein
VSQIKVTGISSEILKPIKVGGEIIHILNYIYIYYLCLVNTVLQ